MRQGGMHRRGGLGSVLFVLGMVTPAFGQEPPAEGDWVPPVTPPVVEPAEPSVSPPEEDESPWSGQLEGYVETYYQFNFNVPDNHITNFRGWDNRHNSITLSNATIGGSLRYDAVGVRLLLQAGSTPDSYYAAEPARPGADGAAPTGVEVFKHVQEAQVFYEGPVTVDMGILLSPIGPEAMATKDQWTWSRSNLFYGLPAYHTAARIAYQASDSITLRVGAYNGWNSVIDNNDEKSLSGELIYSPSDDFKIATMYFSGVERDTDAPEGRAWRHLLDSYVTFSPVDRLELTFNVDLGIEPNNFGTSGWATGAAFVRVRATDWLYVAAMGDFFYEHVAEGASPIFWPVDWMAQGTATLDFRPTEDHLAFKLEYRHDHAAGNAFFRGSSTVDASGAFIANATYQDTLLVGATAWF